MQRKNWETLTPGSSFLYGSDSRLPVRGADVETGAIWYVGRCGIPSGLVAWEPLTSLLQTVITGGKFLGTFQNSFPISLWEPPLWCFRMRSPAYLLVLLAAASQNVHSDSPDLSTPACPSFVESLVLIWNSWFLEYLRAALFLYPSPDYCTVLKGNVFVACI